MLSCSLVSSFIISRRSAIDFCNRVNGELVWKVDDNWMKVVNVFKKHGFSWGGDWETLKDYPHLEMNFGKTWQAFYECFHAGKIDSDGFVIV